MMSLKGKVLTGTVKTISSPPPNQIGVGNLLSTLQRAVNGSIDPKDLGVVLPHEYCLIDFQCMLRDAEYGLQTNISSLPVELKHLGKIRQFPAWCTGTDFDMNRYSVRDNLVLDSKEDAISELRLYRRAGGRTLCDVTPKGLRYCPEALPEISKESGVNIVTGTAYYVDFTIPRDVKNMTIQQISDELVSDIRDGIEGSGGVRCGFIREMGCSHPLTPSEVKCLKAAALAQQKTGAPLCIHPGRDQESPFQILDILEEAGADISHTVMAHLDRTIFDNDLLLQFAKRGCYLEYDLFGTECSHYQFDVSTDFLSDAQKIQKVKFLVDRGYADHVLLSHDIHLKHRLVKCGGHGYGHILEHIVPKMVDRGISQEHIKLMLEDNPQKWLTFK